MRSATGRPRTAIKSRFLEEAGLGYTIKPVNIDVGDQFIPEIFAASPDNRLPAIIDRNPADHREPVTVFESGAILLYLAEKTANFSYRPTRPENSDGVVVWQMGGLGPVDTKTK